MKAIRVHAYGGPDALRYEEVPQPKPQAGEALVEIEAIGINFIDVQHREGRYKGTQLPFTVGSEAAGIVTAIGSGVTEVAVGDRVAYAMVVGSYAEYAVVPAKRLVKVPAEIELRTAAAVMLQGLTAHYLTHSTYPIKPGDTALVHAAAGGAGQLVTQVARLRGATVYGTAGGEAKLKIARDAGAGFRPRYVAHVQHVRPAERIDPDGFHRRCVEHGISRAW